jgi:tetratricopeptide (TPR) repeat protein
LGFLLVALSFIWDSKTIDRTQAPRLLALYFFLGAVWLFTVLPQVRACLAWSALKSPLVYSYAAYFISVWASLFVAFNISAGFMDAYKTSASFLVLCSAVVLFASTESWPQILAKTSVLAAMLSGGLGQYQLITQIGAAWSSREALTTLTGLMSNVNLYASFLMLLLPLCLLGVAIQKGCWRWLSLLCVCNTAFLLLVLQSRAAWFGACAGAFFAAAMLCWQPDSLGISKKSRNILVFFLSLIVCSLALFVFLGPARNPFVSRFWDIFSSDARYADGGRLAIWQATLRMIADYFPFGVGAGNFTIRLHDYRIGGDLDFHGGHLEWIEPHNDYLSVLSEKGALGGLAFLAIFFFAMRCCIRVLRRGGTSVYAWTALLCFSSVLAYLVNSFFDFPLARVNHQVCLAVLLAALAVADRRSMVLEACSARPWPIFQKNGYLIFICPLLLLLLASGVAYSFAAIRQERHVALARKALEAGEWDTLASHARLAATRWRTLDPYAVPVCFLEGIAYMRQGKNDAAIACFEKARLENPNRFYILNNLGVLYSQRGDYQRAISFLGYAADLYPQRFEILNNLASCYNQVGAYKKALSLLKKIPPEKMTDEVRSNTAIALQGLERKSSVPSKKQFLNSSE